MQRMEAPLEHTSLITPNPERPPVTLNIVTISSPEEQNLPYRVEIDPQKIGDFMRSLGMTDDQIRKTNLTIAYDTRGLANLIKPLDPLGYVNVFTGDLTICAHTIMKRAEYTNKLFQKDLADGSTPEMLEVELSSHRIARRLMGQVFPELLEKGQSESLPELSPLWRTKYANLARQKGEEQRAKDFMEKHLARIIDHNLRMVIPHELIHVEQIKSGRRVGMISRAIPIAISWAALSQSLHYGLRLLRLTVPAANRFPIRPLLGISEFGLQIGLYLRTIREGRKATGIEKEAYERMKDYDDLFTDIVRLVPVGEARPQEETAAPKDIS